VSEALAPTTSPPARTAPLRLVEAVESPALAVVVPSWRGLTHEKAFAFAPALGLLLVGSAEGTLATLAAGLFAATMTAMLGASAANHRLNVGPRWQRWLRSLDHSAINVFLAGTWTSVALVVLSGTTRVALTAVLWGAALTASLVSVIWVRVPGWVPAAIVLGVGWSTAASLFVLAGAVSAVAVGLFVIGGLFYSAGAVVYVLRRPNPWPATFGSHEVFHACVLAGVACHYVALGFFILPLAG
jgi:hemolysin III